MLFIESFIVSKSFFRGKKANGVSIDFQSSGTISYASISVTKEKNSIQKTAEALPSTDKEAFFALLDSSIPICLSLSGTKIVHREMPVSDDQSDSDILNAIFPNAAITDFYIQKDFLSNSRFLISVIRKEVLDSIIEECKAKHLFIVAADIGIGAFTAIMQILPQAEEYRCGSFVIKTAGDAIVSCEKTNELSESLYTVGSDQIDATIINAYALSVFFLSAINQSEAFQTIQAEKEAFLYKSFLKQAGIGITTCFLIILLANFFLFDNFYKKHTKYESMLNQNKDLLVKLDTLKNDLKTKEELFQEAGFVHPSRLSYYSDRIAATISESIILDELNCIPVEKKAKQGQELTVKQACIIVSGNVTSGSELKEWINKIAKENWVETVTILSYLQDNNFIRGDFQINITIKE